MSQTSDERFQELAMKLVNFECTPEEKDELRRLIDRNPARRDELQKRCLSVGIARELLPLAKALEATECRMSDRELETFKAALAQRREKLRRGAGGNQRGPTVIDAELIPAKRINGYKVSFYVLLLLILAAGCALLFKSCMNDRKGWDAARTPTNAVRVIPDQNGQAEARSEPDTPTPAVPAPQVVKPPVTRPPERQNATRTKLGNYAGTQWVKLADSYAVPGSVLFFRNIVSLSQSGPLIEGMSGRNGDVPKDFMLFSRQGKSWGVRSFANVYSEPDPMIALDDSTALVASYGMHREVFLIQGGRSREVLLPIPIRCIGAQSDSTGRIFIHDSNGGVSVVAGASITRLADTDPNNYVLDHGQPTGLRRGFVQFVAKADSGDIMGVHYPQPKLLGHGSLVRFNGENWELVCSFGQKYPGQATHYLSGDSMVAALSQEFLIVKEGVPMSTDLPAGFGANSSTEWRAVRAASTDDFVAVDSSGRIYHYRDGNFEQTVAPLAQYPKAGAVTFRSVMIAPDGVIYAINAKNQWSGSVLFQLTPK